MARQLDLKSYFAQPELRCLECGEWFRQLTLHLYYSHPEIDATGYKHKHGIPLERALVPDEVSALIGANTKEAMSRPGAKEPVRRAMQKIYDEKYRGLEKEKAWAICPDCGQAVETNRKNIVTRRGSMLCSDCKELRAKDSKQRCIENYRAYQRKWQRAYRKRLREEVNG